MKKKSKFPLSCCIQKILFVQCILLILSFKIYAAGTLGYNFGQASIGKNSNYPYTEIETYTDFNSLTGTINSSSGSDFVSNSIPLDFEFNFYGQIYTSIRVSNNGFIVFGNSATNSDLLGLINPITNPNATYTNDAFICGFGADLYCKGNSNSKISIYKNTLSKTDAFTIIQWKNFGILNDNSGNSINFQIKIYKKNSSVSIVYGTNNFVVAGMAEVGIRKGGGKNKRANLSANSWFPSSPGDSTGVNPGFSFGNNTNNRPMNIVFDWTPTSACLNGLCDFNFNGKIIKGSGSFIRNDIQGDPRKQAKSGIIGQNTPYFAQYKLSSEFVAQSASLNVTVNKSIVSQANMSMVIFNDGLSNDITWEGTVPAINTDDAEVSFYASFTDSTGYTVYSDPTYYQIGYLKVKGGPDLKLDSAIHIPEGIKLSAQVSQMPVKFSQITQDVGAIGHTVSYPANINDQDLDLVEIANFSNQDSVNISGWQVIVETTDFTRTFTYPNNSYLRNDGSNTFSVLNIGNGDGGYSGLPNDDPSHNYFNMGGDDNSLGSGTPAGFILKNKAGDIIDVVATNGYEFSAASGVTFLNWYGDVANSEDYAGIIRNGQNDFDRADEWIVADSLHPQYIGHYNLGNYTQPNFSFPLVKWSNPFFDDYFGTDVTVPFDSSGHFPFVLTVVDDFTSSRDTVVVDVVKMKKPVANFIAADLKPYLNQTVTITDKSSTAVDNSPSNWLYIITPSTYSFVNSTNQNSQNPQVKFLSTGYYTISLVSSNEVGSNTKTKTSYIQVKNYASSCTIPGSLSTKSIHSTSAVFLWNRAIAADTFEVEYSNINCGQTVKRNVFVNNPGINTLSVTDLTPLTFYYWRVRSICNGVKGGYSCKRFFLTPCQGSRLEGGEIENNTIATSIFTYPNPASDQLTVKFDADGSEFFTVFVYDLSGRELLKTTDISIDGENKVSLNLTGISAGMAIVALEKEGLRSFSKVIIRR